MKKNKKAPLVFFNASVVIAGIKSPKGGSGKLLSWIKNKRIKGIISEIIRQEIIKNAPKINIRNKNLQTKTDQVFPVIIKEPDKKTVDQFLKIITDAGDAHVLASAQETKADFLVSLDKKHILILKRKIKNFQIISPGELIEKLNLK